MSIMIVAWASSPWKHGQDGRATAVQISYEHWLKCRNKDASKKIFVATGILVRLSEVRLCRISIFDF